ncbi:MAG: LysR family transcriptional regulator [Rhizobiales bacterium]|nr:LysR family transcriptional regulator [Hyphomicrobiales bacterium]
MAEPPAVPLAVDAEFGSQISWDDLRAFLAVSVHGSMNRAAMELGESQPTIGRRMRRLEEQTRVMLFLRGPNNLTFTPAAKALAEVLEPMGEASRAVKGIITTLAARDGHPVRLTSTNSIAIFLSERIGLLRQAAAPRDVVLLPTRNFIDVMRGGAELALRMRQVDPEPGLLVRKVAVVSATIYGRAGLDDLPMIIPPVSRMFSGYRELALRELAHRKQGPQIDELHLRLQAIRAGVGAGILPCWIGDADPQLVRLSGQVDPFVHEDMFLIRSERSRGDAAVEAVAQALIGLFRKNRDRLRGHVD